MKKQLALFFIPFFLYAGALSFGVSDSAYEVGLTSAKKLSRYKKARAEIGYISSKDEFSQNQSLIFANLNAYKGFAYRRWQVGSGVRILNSNINYKDSHNNFFALPLSAHAIYALPIRKRTYLAFSLFYAPPLLTSNDEFNGFNEFDIKVDLILTRRLRGFVVNRQINFHHEDDGNYEFGKFTLFGLKYIY